jgi:hypothetical protein
MLTCSYEIWPCLDQEVYARKQASTPCRCRDQNMGCHERYTTHAGLAISKQQRPASLSRVRALPATCALEENEASDACFVGIPCADLAGSILWNPKVLLTSGVACSSYWKTASRGVGFSRVVPTSEAQLTGFRENYASHRETPRSVLPTGSCGSQSTNHTYLAQAFVACQSPRCSLAGRQSDLGLTSRSLAWDRTCRIANHDSDSIRIVPALQSSIGIPRPGRQVVRRSSPGQMHQSARSCWQACLGCQEPLSSMYLEETQLMDAVT